MDSDNDVCYCCRNCREDSPYGPWDELQVLPEGWAEYNGSILCPKCKPADQAVLDL